MTLISKCSFVFIYFLAIGPRFGFFVFNCVRIKSQQLLYIMVTVDVTELHCSLAFQGHSLQVVGKGIKNMNQADEGWTDKTKSWRKEGEYKAEIKGGGACLQHPLLRSITGRKAERFIWMSVSGEGDLQHTA